jgi:hypothetical protein
MIHVRRHKRETASGKSVTVRAHEREGGGEVISEKPEWAQAARPGDFERGPVAPATWTDEDAEPAGDWWADEPTGCPRPGDEEPAMLRKLFREVREVRAEDKQLRADLRAGRKEYGTDWRTGSTDPDLDPDAEPDSPALARMKDDMRHWRSLRIEAPPGVPDTSPLGRVLGTDTQEGADSYARLKAYREAGYDGPLDQDNRIPDPDDPDEQAALSVLASLRER